MDFIKKETGRQAKTALEYVVRIYGHPMQTDHKTTYSKNQVNEEDRYWVTQCPRCRANMHAAYFSINGVRYLCASCGFKSGAA